MHPHYDRIAMTNDLALIKLDQPLLFNRWVRPACLPKLWLSEHFSSKEPLFDETCVTAGWGAVFEHGPDRKFKSFVFKDAMKTKKVERR